MARGRANTDQSSAVTGQRVKTPVFKKFREKNCKKWKAKEGEWQTRSNACDLAAVRGLDNHPAFRQRLVVCFYLPNTPAKKKSQEEIGSAGKKSQSREHRAHILKLDCTASQSLGGWDDPCLLSGVTKVLGTQRAPGKDKMGTSHTPTVGCWKQPRACSRAAL